MGKKAAQLRRTTHRRLRSQLTEAEKVLLRKSARYEGSPYHKRNPGDFGLTPPANPRPDATLCDEANVLSVGAARELFSAAIERGLVSASGTGEFPKQLWAVDETGQVFATSSYPWRRSQSRTTALLLSAAPWLRAHGARRSSAVTRDAGIHRLAEARALVRAAAPLSLGGARRLH